MKKIALLTSGGDAPGMNACARAVVRTATYYGMKPYVVYEGYKGLVEGNIKEAGRFAEIINRGGTAIYTSRLSEFKDEKVRSIAIKNLQELGIDSLVVIGGDGSYRGANALVKMGFNCMCIPGTIDNDIASTDYTIGFDTALNTIVEAVDKIRDTSGSHQRCSIVEVMGRNCGDLAISAGVACGAEVVITSDTGFNKEAVLKRLKECHISGKRHAIVIVTENITDVNALAKEIEEYSGYGCRATVLGYVQRGGNPTANDRIIASKLGSYAVDLLHKNEFGKAVGIINGKMVNFDIEEAINMKREKSSLYQITEKLL